MSEPTAPAAVANNNNNNTPPSMDTPFVWVRLYWADKDKGTEEPAGDDPIIIRPVPTFVADLKKKVKDDDLKEELQRIGITQLKVYPPKSCASREKYPASKELSAVMAELRGTTPPTSSDHPLVVVAPAQKQQQQRLVYCRTWSSEGNHLPYNLLANSYDDLKQQIQGESDLEEFMQISNTPAVLAWERDSDGSPTEFPGEIAAPFSGSNVSSISTSTRGHIQKVFQAAVLERDMQKCVVSGKVYKQGSSNVEAAHIIPVTSPPDLRRQAGLHGLYDTRNGMLLESRLHEAFDSYVWCMDEEGKFRLSDAESHTAKIKDYGLAKWEGNTLNLRIGFDPDAPTKETLKARYELFRAMVAKSKAGKKVSRKKKK